MNIKITISLLSVWIPLCFYACHNETDRSFTDVAAPSDNVIRVLPQINNLVTRTGLDNSNFTCENREFGLFILPQMDDPKPENTYNNVRMVYKNNMWNDYDPTDGNATVPLNSLYWSVSRPLVKVTAYLPYQSDVPSSNIITGKIGNLQNEELDGGSLAQNDYLYFNGAVNPWISDNIRDVDGKIIEYALLDGKIGIPFRHMASKLKLKIKLGTEFNVTSPGTTTNPISDLKINGTVCHFNFDLSTGSFSNTIESTEPVSPWYDASSYVVGEGYSTKSLANYECILVPQTVSAGVFSVSFAINGKKYQWISKTTVPLVSGKQHNLSLDVGENIIVLSDFTVTDWNVTDIPVSPDLLSRIEVDPASTTLGEDVSLSLENALLHFTSMGGTATLAFTGEYDKKYEIINADPRLSIVPEEGVYQNTAFKITASTQTNENAQYSVRLLVSNPFLTIDKGVEITINVDGAIIPSVEMGGLVWMTFNGIGRDPALYLHNPQLTMREIYAKDWKKYSGICMWGPREKPTKILYPWEVVNTKNETATIVDNSTPDWTAEYSDIPCPEGWRLPTYSELGKIWSGTGVYVPGTYTIDGIQYSSSIIESGAPQIPVDENTSLPTKLFVISDGKNELLFPIVGWRLKYEDANQQSAMALNVGEAFFLWSQDRGVKGAYASIVGLQTNQKTFCSSSFQANTTKAECYHAVRCVKNK